MGDTSQTHFHGIWKIRQQTRSRNNVEQKVEAKNHRHRVYQRKCHHHHDPGEPTTHQIDECTFSTQNMRTTTLRRCTKQSRNTWRVVKNTFQSLEETSTLSWDLAKEWNVKVWAGTLSTKVTREVTG